MSEQSDLVATRGDWYGHCCGASVVEVTGLVVAGLVGVVVGGGS